MKNLMIKLNYNLLEEIHHKYFNLMTKETKNIIKTFESSYPMN
jgi:hypothetical protein